MEITEHKIYTICGIQYKNHNASTYSIDLYTLGFQKYNQTYSNINYYPSYKYTIKPRTNRYSSTIIYGTNLIRKRDIIYENGIYQKQNKFYGVIKTKEGKPITTEQVEEALTWPYKKPQIDWDCVKEEGCKWSFKQGNIKLRVIDLKDRYRCYLRIGKKNRSFTCPHNQIEQKIKLAKLKLL